MKVKLLILLCFVVSSSACSSQNSVSAVPYTNRYSNLAIDAFSPKWTGLYIFEDHKEGDTALVPIHRSGGAFTAEFVDQVSSQQVRLVLGYYRTKESDKSVFLAVLGGSAGDYKVLDVRTWESSRIPSLYWSENNLYLSLAFETDQVKKITIKHGTIIFDDA